jgi:N-acetylmuramoyl-L-alanine amidase
MLPITKQLLTNKKNRPFLRDPKNYAIKQLKGIVAHWTANTDKGATAKANVHYFEIADRFASAHFVVDDHSIYQCVPDNEVAYHVGAKLYRADGERIRAGSGTPNNYLIGFEMCVNSDGDWNKTYKNSTELAAYLLGKYQFTVHDLYRHHDITGKDCPKMMLEEAKWAAFKQDIAEVMQKAPPVRIGIGTVTSSELNIRKGPGTNFAIAAKLKKNDPVPYFEQSGTWLRIGTDRWVSANFVQIEYVTQLGRIVAPKGSTVHKTDDAKSPIVDVIPNGVLVNLLNHGSAFYEIGEGRWVPQTEVQTILTRIGTVSGANDLNVRQGPDTSFKVLYRLSKGAQVRVLAEDNGWLQIGFSEWVFGGFIAF